MTKFKGSRMGLFVGAAALALTAAAAPAAMAQTPDAARATISEVIVTATKSATNMQKTPISISVIGGAAIFALFEPIADRIELTEVLETVEGDVSMPDLRSSERWHEVASEDHLATGDTPSWRTVSLVRA